MTRPSGTIVASPPILDVQFTVTNITGLRMTKTISEIHLEAFRGYLNTLLGPRYAYALIEWHVIQKDAIALAAIDSNQQIVGYAIGGPMGFGQQLRSDMFWVTAQSIILRPWVVLDKRLWKVGLARFTAKRSSRKSSVKSYLPVPIFSLRGIAVRSSHQQKGVGKLLLHAFEQKAKMLKAKSLVLSVYPDKTAARRLYETCGWRLLPGNTQSTSTLKYVQILDSPCD